jgi:hypothetical protein
VTNEEKIELFFKELGFIQNPNIKKFVETALTIVPDYFYEIPASSSGRYHPSYALGEGGLVRHTKAAVRIMHEILQLEMMRYTDIEKDMMIAALILHDTYKSGLNHAKFTVTEHPIIAAEQLSNNKNLDGIISDEQRKFIALVISTHMGQFNQDFKTKKEVLPKPKSKYQSLVHLCDYLASRKCLEFNFNV